MQLVFFIICVGNQVGEFLLSLSSQGHSFDYLQLVGVCFRVCVYSRISSLIMMFWLPDF